MRNFFKNLVVVAVLTAGVFLFRVELRERVWPIWRNAYFRIFPKAACVEPIPYALGIFDKKFNISKEYFESAILDAEAVWEKPLGKDFFVYAPDVSPTDNLKINLVYDYRQEATSKLASLGINVKNDRDSYDKLKIKFTELKSKLAVAKKDYEEELRIFNGQKRAYETLVQYWNEQGGAPRAEYNKLQAEESELDILLRDLQIKQARVNEMVTEINSAVVVLNRLADILNISVDKYNTEGSSRGESFEEGVYISDGQSQQIDIYEFSSRQKLVRVLAHELGHALGLEHVEDPKAIMYRLNQGSAETLSQTDIEALEIICQIK